MAAQHLGNLALTLPRHKQGGNLVSLFLGQLSVSHHCFTLVGKANEGTGNGPPSSTSLSQSAAVIICIQEKKGRKYLIIGYSNKITIDYSTAFA